MSNQSYSSKAIDHLGLVSAMCSELGVSDFIDQAIPNQSNQRHISYGQLLVAMIVNGLGFVSRTLHMYPDFYASKPVERLIGSGIKAEHINDDALGRCLDKLYEHDVSSLYQQLSERVVKSLGLKCETVHLDSTSFHVDGEYEVDDDFKGIRLTKGYSRDHRPELNQVILNLITENQAGLPVYMQACSGNTNDSESFKKLVKSHISSLKAAQDSTYFIGDASLYVAETIKSLDEQNQFFITRVPQKINEAKALIASQSTLAFTPLKKGYSGSWFESNYGDVSQRWLLIKSEQASKRENKMLDKKVIKSMDLSMRSFKKLCAKSFNCENDAEKALASWLDEQQFVGVSEPKYISNVTYTKAGRPKREEEGTLVFYITGQLYTCLAKKEDESEKKGLFILATNDCSDNLSMEAMLENYKSQQAVEKGFRFLKSPDFLTSSFFLKKPERIEALLMVMTCCLMIYAALEHKIRSKLQEKSMFFPDMKNKPSQKPTARWVFFCFQGISELLVEQTELLIINMQDRQKVILDCLGPQYWQVYS